ncbi:MAG: hypothetical protein R2788_12195 [Saprospiraceae bacterium]
MQDPAQVAETRLFTRFGYLITKDGWDEVQFEPVKTSKQVGNSVAGRVSGWPMSSGGE